MMRRIKMDDIIWFWHELKMLLKSDYSLSDALALLSEGNSKAKLDALFTSIKSDVDHGMPFSEALKKQPKYFDMFVVALIQIGESKNDLPHVIEEVVEQIQVTTAMGSTMKRVLLYPMFILVMVMFFALVMSIVVIPVFAEMYAPFSAELPLPTQMIFAITDFILTFWWPLNLLFLACVGAWWKSRYFRYALANILPGLSTFLRYASIMELFLLAKLAMENNKTKQEAFTFAALSISNPVYQRKLKGKFEGETTSIASVIETCKWIPKRVVKMLQTAEKVGAMETSSQHIASCYREKAFYTLEMLRGKGEPVLLFLLSFVVGGFVIAMYLPIFQMGSIS